MSYAGSMNPNRRAAVLGGVAALHVVAGYFLVTGMAVSFIKTELPRIYATDVPITPLPEPTVPPTPSDSAAKPSDTPFTAPTTSVTLAPPSEGVIVTLPTLPPATDGGGIGDVVFPTPTPSVSPSFAAMGPKPRGRQGEWVGPMDYPSTDLRLEHAGVTRVQLGIGADGRVTACTVTGSSGWPGLDSAACARLTQRGRFDPATDTSGARVAGRYDTSVKWEIPE